ncbi:meiosis-specific protein ASY3 isoform X2 [Rhododendron vialii]|uniref:meiosis-specific protein ASY3 isoform X2 n=1 Tax=Rhododendron vialii TaxID=182163 RepID=UPI00265EF5D7|nr:meiosis-specific protein ASY3 isoform X2 [Rhododendron vialii]
MTGESSRKDVHGSREAITYSDDHVSDWRSFGSNCHPWSQSRKISIGVMVDYSANTRPKMRKEDDVVVPNAEKVPAKVNPIGDGNCGGPKDVIQGNHTAGPEPESSPWVSTRSLHVKQHNAELTMDLPAGDGRSNSLSGVNEAPRTFSVQCFGNQMSVLQSGDAKQKNCDSVSYGSGGKNGPKEKEEFLFANAQERYAPDKDVVEDETNRTGDRREALRKKLWDILGTVSSPNKQVSQALEVGVNNLNPEQNIDKNSKPVVKPRQNSDTIEADSDSPDHTTRRPVTRSLTRKRAPSKVQTNKIKDAPSRTRKLPQQNILSFEEGLSGRLDAAVIGRSPKSNSKKRERKGSKAEAHSIFFSPKANAGNIQQPTFMSKKTKCAEKTSSIGNMMERLRSYPPEHNSEFADMESRIRKQDSPQLQAMKMTDQLGNPNYSVLPQHRDRQEDLADLSSENTVDPHVDLQSPTFEFRTLNKSVSHSSPPESNHGERDDHTPSHCSFNSLIASKPDYHKADAETESSDDAEELGNSPLMKSQPHMKEKDAEYWLSESSFEERNSKSSKEGWGTESPTPEICTRGKPKFVLYPSKRLRSHEDIRLNGGSPMSASPKGTEESTGLLGTSGENQDDGLANAITLITLALERVKSKIKSLTSKKSAEVLMSVAEGIHLQLQNAESHIQRDVGKLKSLSRSKRKRLETEFEEQKEKLKLIYQKFKAEVNQHMQECRSTVEGMEAQEIEFRGLMEKQKTSQRKLLKQVEETIETQLDDGERRITAVQKLAKEKVLQLRYVVAECLKEGVLS